MIERAVHDVFDNASDYEELEDDFLFIANEGQVAILPSEEAQITKGNVEREDNTDVQILQGVEDDEEKALREYRERMAAMLPPAGDFKTVFAGQNDLDADFDAFMDEEYDDGEIGEGAQEPEAVDQIT